METATIMWVSHKIGRSGYPQNNPWEWKICFVASDGATPGAAALFLLFCWCSAGNENCNDPYKPSNWWFPLRGPPRFTTSFPTYRTSKSCSPPPNNPNFAPPHPARPPARSFAYLGCPTDGSSFSCTYFSRMSAWRRLHFDFFTLPAKKMRVRGFTRHQFAEEFRLGKGACACACFLEGYPL